MRVSGCVSVRLLTIKGGCKKHPIHDLGELFSPLLGGRWFYIFIEGVGCKPYFKWGSGDGDGVGRLKKNTPTKVYY